MLKRYFTFVMVSLFITQPLFADDEAEAIKPKFEAFTGNITKNKVRMRLQPNLDAPIVRELDKDQLVVVVGETEDFYIVQPTPDIKAYIYRTYVLENTVEGHHVNVRIEPHVQAPIIAQLNTGDKIEGKISPLNSKWLEISPPESTQLYIAMEYIEKIGDEHYMAAMQQRRNEVNGLLSSSYNISKIEMQKPFPQIDLNGIYKNYNEIIDNYTDFPEQVGRAKRLLTQLQSNYLEKKVAYLEALAKNTNLALKNNELNQEKIGRASCRSRSP